MLARIRLLASGGIAGFGVAKASNVLAEKLDEDPDFLRNAFASLRLSSSEKQPASSSTDAPAKAPPPRKTVALIKMTGQIAAPSPSPLGSSSSINLDRYNQQLTAAFRSPTTAAVAIEMNSPGGSPVQSALLHNRLRALKEQHPQVQLLVYCTDVCASGGYYISSAADEIHVLPSTIIGSIGVVSPSFGVAELLKKNGVEDRTLTAGTSKVGDTPWQPRDPIAVAKKRALLEELHDDFKSAVTAGRGDKLKHAEAAALARKAGDKKSRAERAEALFDGSVYAGRTAVRLGLADGLYDELGGALKARFGDDVKVVERKSKAGLLEKLQAMQEANAEASAAALWREARVAMSHGATLGGPGSLA